jgi:hypothetical protein
MQNSILIRLDLTGMRHPKDLLVLRTVESSIGYLTEKYPRAAKVGECKEKEEIGKVAHRATFDLMKLLSSCQETSVVTKGYVNSTFVGLMLERRICEDFERLAERMDVTAETIMGNAIVLILKEVENMTRSMISLPPSKLAF